MHLSCEQELTGRIFNIQKYSIYDGDGIRTLVFFKGCNILFRPIMNTRRTDADAVAAVNAFVVREHHLELAGKRDRKTGINGPHFQYPEIFDL
jgi:hypothetical protein